MIGVSRIVSVTNQSLMGGDNRDECSGDTPMVCEFIEGEGCLDNVGTTSAYEFEKTEKKNYWESQHQLLQTSLYKTSSMESKIRQATKEAFTLSKTLGVICSCRTPPNNGCRNCLLRDISGRLRRAGIDSAIGKSQWRSSPDIPSGEHTYINVVHKSSTKDMEVRVVIELEFRAEFEMGRTSKEYNTLIENLPELYVGKAERLRSLIKILCSAGKRCMKDMNVYMGPWRKHKYMQAKWFSTCETTRPVLSSSQLLKKSNASLLTSDLLEQFPTVQVL